MKTKFQIKKISFVFIICFFLLSFVSDIRNYQTECVSIETDGYITIKIWDTKKGVKYKAERARKDAIHSILFSGIAGGKSCSTQLPILRNSEEQNKFKSIEKKFFSNKGKWMFFARSSATETTLPDKLITENLKVYQVSISKNELRKYLEEEKIINSLNKGF